MTLNEFLASEKRRIYGELTQGDLGEGRQVDKARMADLVERGEPTMGTTVIKPDLLTFEFVYTLDDGQSEVLPVSVVPPERVVFLPVPSWVVESVWQGEVAGSYHFESDAKALIEEFARETDPQNNGKWFEKLPPKRRE